MDIAAWLRDLGLEQYAPAFAANAIDAEVLLELTEADLEELDVLLGHRKKLLKAIAALAAQSPEPPAPAAPDQATRIARQAAGRRQLTIMFVDLVGSTALSARLDPEDMREVLRAYQSTVATEIARFGGHVAKFMGDGVLAYFGWPRAHEDAADRAVRAGLLVRDAVASLQAPDGDRLACRVGIATGLVVVGDLIGAGTAREQLVVGETPALAARLQGLAEPGGVVIASGTRQLIGGRFELADLGTHALKGFGAPVQVWSALEESRIEGRFESRRASAQAPLVNRLEELGHLRACWQTARGGHGRVVLLSGEPGMGKSRLLQALRDDLAEVAHLHLRYDCSPYHVNSALYPVVDHLERAAELHRDDPPEAKLGKLETLLGRSTERVPEAAALLAPLLSIPTGARYPPTELSPSLQKARTLELLIGQLAALAARQPLLMVIEDAHWIDPTTQELIELTIERIPQLPVLMVITFRPTYEAPWAGRPGVSSLSVVGLDREHSTELLSQTVVGRTLSAEVLDQILDRADGVPLYVEELTRSVLELVEHEPQDPAPLHAGQIPASLHDSLMARLDHLKAARDLALLAAVLGRRFYHDHLAAVAQLGPDELAARLAELSRAELIRPAGKGREVAYEFRHSLIQEVAYQSLLRTRRAEVHRRVAETLQQRFPEVADNQPEVLARHFTEAGATAEAIRWWRAAGEQAARRSANLEALAHFRMALRLLADGPATPERSEQEAMLLLLLGARLLALQGYASPEVRTTYERALELSLGSEGSSSLLPVLWGLWGYYVVRADLRRAAQIGERFLRLAGELQQPVALVAAHYASGVTAFYRGDLAAARQHLGQALAHYTPAQRHDHAALYGQDLAIACHSYLGWVLALTGRPAGAIAASARALAGATDAEHAFSLAFAEVFAAQTDHFLRDVESARAAAGRALELSANHGFAQWEGQARLQLGRAWERRGEARGLEAMRRGLDAYRATGAALARPYAHAWLAEAWRDRGDHSRALALVEEMLDDGERSGERYYDAELLRLKGEILWARGAADARQASATLRKAIAVARRQGALTLQLRAETSLCRALADAGKRGVALRSLAATLGRFTDGVETRDRREAAAVLVELG